MDNDTFKTLSQSLQNGSIKELLTQTLNMLIEAEFANVIGAKKSERTTTRKGYRCGYRTRRFDTTCGTLTLRIPHPLKGGYIPSFLKRYQRYEQALKQTISDAYVNGVSTGKMKQLVRSMGVDGISKGQVSRITSELNHAVDAFKTRSLRYLNYPVLFIDAMFERVRQGSHANYCAILTVVGMDENNRKQILAVEAAPDESAESYTLLLKNLKRRGLKTPRLIVSDGALGLLKAMSIVMPEACWQRCQVHFMRNIMQSVKHADKPAIVSAVKHIWHTADKRKAIARANKVICKYERKYPTAMTCLRDGVLDTLTYMDFKEFDLRKIKTSNAIERIHEEFRRRSKSIRVFPNIESCIKLFTLLAIKYNRLNTYINVIGNQI